MLKLHDYKTALLLVIFWQLVPRHTFRSKNFWQMLHSLLIVRILYACMALPYLK